MRVREQVFFFFFAAAVLIMTTAVWQAEALYYTLLNMCDVICGHNALGCCEDSYWG